MKTVVFVKATRLQIIGLVAPYCAIPRDYLSDTPLLRAMGFLVSQHGQLGAIPPPPFLSISPLESMRRGGAIPPTPQGYLSRTRAIPYENKANGCDTPLCDTISKGYCAIWGGISHWAAKIIGLATIGLDTSELGHGKGKLLSAAVYIEKCVYAWGDMVSKKMQQRSSS